MLRGQQSGKAGNGQDSRPSRACGLQRGAGVCARMLPAGSGRTSACSSNLAAWAKTSRMSQPRGSLEAAASQGWMTQSLHAYSGIRHAALASLAFALSGSFPTALSFCLTSVTQSLLNATGDLFVGIGDLERLVHQIRSTKPTGHFSDVRRSGAPVFRVVISVGAHGQFHSGIPAERPTTRPG